MANPIRVGIVGASPTRGWALGTHLPLLEALPGYELVAVATTRQPVRSRRPTASEHPMRSATRPILSATPTSTS